MLTDQTKNIEAEIRVVLNEENLAYYQWNLSTSVAELREFLEREHSDEISTNVQFLDALDFPVRKEGSIPVTKLIRENNVIQLRTIAKAENAKLSSKIEDKESSTDTALKDKKSTSVRKNINETVEVPAAKSKELQKYDEPTFLSEPSRSPKSSLNAPKIPGSGTVNSATDIIVATQLDRNIWKQVFDNCKLFYGIRMDDNKPAHGFQRVFKFKESEDCLPLFHTNDDSYIRAYMTDKQLESSFVSSKFSDGGFDISCPFIGVGINGEYSKSKANTTEERTVYSTCCFNHPRANLELDPSYLELTSEFVKAIDSIFEQPLYQQLISLKQVLSTFGHVYPRNVVVGGHLYHTEAHRVKGVAEEEETRIAAETHFKVKIKVPITATATAGFRKEKQSGNQSYQQDSDATFQAVGGNTLLCQNPATWASTVAHPNLWRVIQYGKYQSVIKLLNQERQQKIQAMIDASNNKQGMVFPIKVDQRVIR